MLLERTSINISNDKKYVYRVARSERCCWECFTIYGEASEFWSNCGENDQSYTYVLRVCIACATNGGQKGVECSDIVGDHPVKPSESRYKECKYYQEGLAYQLVNGDWEFSKNEEFTVRDVAKWDTNYVFQKKCHRWE